MSQKAESFVFSNIICFKICTYLNGFSFVFAANITENLTPNGTATQSSDNDPVKGKAENAINPPISNEYSVDNCSSTKLSGSGIQNAWWMFSFSFDTAYITDVTIYYRENCKYYQSIYTRIIVGLSSHL